MGSGRGPLLVELMAHGAKNSTSGVKEAEDVLAVGLRQDGGTTRSRMRMAHDRSVSRIFGWYDDYDDYMKKNKRISYKSAFLPFRPFDILSLENL